MSSRYEFWLLSDTGSRLALLNPPEGHGLSFFDYSRSTQGLGSLHFGMPKADYDALVPYPWVPDRMLDLWRSAGDGFPMRRENVYFLRKFNLYTRDTDGVQLIEFWGRDAKDLLNRRVICQPTETSYTRKGEALDDMMKNIVREQMQYGYTVDESGLVSYPRAWPFGEFSVEHNSAVGPVPPDPISMVDRRVMDMVKELRDLSLQLHQEDSSKKQIWFDVLAGESLDWNKIWILEEAASFTAILDETGDEFLDEMSTAAIVEQPISFQFQTFPDLYGQDRTGGPEFSVENGNLKSPTYGIDHLDEQNTIIVRGSGVGNARLTEVVQDDVAAFLSTWARVEGTTSASQETDLNAMADVGRADIWDKRRKEVLDASFLSTPGGPDTPRTLYGVDWDLGDLLPIRYAGLSFNGQVLIVYVSMSESGAENITGRQSTNE